VLGEGLAVRVDRLCISRLETGCELRIGMENKRRLVLDTRLAALLGHELRIEEIGRGLLALRFDTLRNALARGLDDVGVAGLVLILLQIDAVIPDIQHAHIGVVVHTLAILAHEIGRETHSVAIGQLEMLRQSRHSRRAASGPIRRARAAFHRDR